MFGASDHTKVWATKEMYEDEVNWQHGAGRASVGAEGPNVSCRSNGRLIG